MYLYLYIHFDTISRTTLNSTLCLAQTGTSTKVALVMRERERERESSVSHQSSADRYLVIRKGISPHSAGTLLVSPITTLPNYFLSNLPKSLRNYTSSGKKGRMRKQLNATIIIIWSMIPLPNTHPLLYSHKRFTWWSVTGHLFHTNSVFFSCLSWTL